MVFGFIKSLSEFRVLERRFDCSSACGFDDDLLENLSLFMVARIVSEIRLVKRGSVENLASLALALTAECFPAKTVHRGSGTNS